MGGKRTQLLRLQIMLMKFPELALQFTKKLIDLIMIETKLILNVSTWLSK